MKKIYISSFLLCFNINGFTPNGYCKVPVADLTGAPISTFYKKHSENDAAELYRLIPYNNSTSLCCRIGQLVYNDPIEIIQYKDNEVQIRTPQWQYASNNTQKLYESYWTLSSNISPLTEKNATAHPCDVPFKAKNQTIIVLDKPWYCKKTKTLYSLGTRFVYDPHQKQSKNYYSVLYEHNESIKKISIPHSHSHIEKNNTPHEARLLFVNYIRSWAHENYPIQYVLGGTSHTKYHETSNILQSKPLIGFDCNKMIIRAAHLSGIPLYTANSLALSNTLKLLKDNEVIENGDIIYFTGHVAVITDKDKGLLAEARSYTESKNGRVHEISFNQQFEGINTIDDLIQAYKTRKKIVRLNEHGQKAQIINHLKLFKLC